MREERRQRPPKEEEEEEAARDALAPAAPHVEAGLSRERVAGSVPGWWDPAEKAGAAAGRASAAGRAPGSDRSGPTPPPGRPPRARSQPGAGPARVPPERRLRRGIMSAGQQGPPPPDEPPAPPGAGGGEAAGTAPAGPAGADAAMEVRRVSAAAPRTSPEASARHEGRRGGPGDNGGAGAGPSRASRRLRGGRPAAPGTAEPRAAIRRRGGAGRLGLTEAGRGVLHCRCGSRPLPRGFASRCFRVTLPRRTPPWRQRVRGAETWAL